MTRIWLVNWHFQLRIILWCRHKSTNVSMELYWQIPKFIVWRLWSIYFDLPLKPSVGKRRKQSCTPNIYICCVNPTDTYCKKFRGNRHNRKAVSVRTVWLSGRTEVYQLEGETKPEFETRSVLIFFSIINCLHYTSFYRILGAAQWKE